MSGMDKVKRINSEPLGEFWHEIAWLPAPLGAIIFILGREKTKCIMTPSDVRVHQLWCRGTYPRYTSVTIERN